MTIFICSSLNDISDILYQIESKKIKDFKIIVTQYKQCYNFFCNFFEKEQVIFLESNLRKKPRKIKSWITELKILIKLFFFPDKKSVKEVFLSAPIYDLVGCYLIFIVFKNAKAYLPKRVYDEINVDNIELPNRIFLHSLYSFFYRMPIASYVSKRHVNSKGEADLYNHIPGLPKKIISERFYLTKHIPEEILLTQTKKYLIKYNDHNIENAIIILDNSARALENIINSEEVYSKVFDFLNDEKLFLKPYYANKNSPLEKFNFTVLNMEFPIELYDLSQCKSIICIFSSGLVKVYPRNLLKICLINLVEFKSNNEKLGWDKYINMRFDNTAFFLPKTFEEFKHLFKQ